MAYCACEIARLRATQQELRILPLESFVVEEQAAMRELTDSTGSPVRAPRRLAGATKLGRTVVRDPGLVIGIGILGSLVLLAIVGPIAWPDDPIAINIGASLQPPSLDHPMGTDGLGRDVFARFCAGARISLAVGAVVMVAGALVGGTIGLIAGVSRGSTDGVLMRTMDAILAFPPLILAIAISMSLGPGVMTATIGITVTTVPYYARVVRNDVLRIRSAPFVEATAALGATRTRLMARHVVPHVGSTILVQGAAVFGYAILSLAALGFLGLGARVPTPEWGAMITDGFDYALTGEWWLGLFPGLGVLFAVIGASIVADRARDILDPRGDYAYV